jgi:hypothetical protein
VNGLIAHLEDQLASTRRLLLVVIAQGESIRVQDVEGVLARLAEIQQEMVKRIQLERDRDALLARAAQELRVPVDSVTLEMLLTAIPEPDATRARTLSAELRGLLAEIARIHGQNRILIRQELQFLDHLMRVLSGTPQTGYTPVGQSAPLQSVNLVDMRV